MITNTNLSKYKTTAFLLLVAILLIINSHRASAQSCVYSVSPTTLYFEYNPSETNGVQAVYVDAPFWCDTYTAEPGETWINVLHIDYEEQVVYIVPDDNYGGDSRYGYVDIDGINVTINQECGPPEQPWSISGLSTRCKGTSGTYSISSLQGATYYTWSATNGGSIVSGQGTTSVSISFPNSGTSTVSVFASNSCGEGESRSLNVTVVNAPSVTASSNSPVCTGDTIYLYSSGGGSYSWTGTDSMTSTLQNPIIPEATTAISGDYYVTVTDGNGCTNTDTAIVTVYALPNATASNNCPVLKDETIHLYSSGGVSYSWSGPNSFSSSDEDPSISNATTAMTGTYYVTVTNSNGCSKEASTTVVVNRELDTTLPVGKIPASYNVSPDGSFNYQIPVSIPR